MACSQPPFIYRIKNSRWFRAKKLRVLAAWLGLFFLFFYSRSTDHGFRIGLPLVIIGELLRLWAGGFQAGKGEILVTNGPYAFTRNPLYVGNFLIGLGVLLVTKNPVLLALFLAGFFWIYSKTVEQEERDLVRTFGDLYQKYREEVPRFLPRLSPYPSRTQMPFRWKHLWRQREYLTLIGIVVLLSCLYVWEEIVLEREGPSGKVALAFIGSFLLGVLAFVEWVFLRRRMPPSANALGQQDGSETGSFSATSPGLDRGTRSRPLAKEKPVKFFSYLV